MKHLFIALLFLITSMIADVVMKKVEKEKEETILPIEKPLRPIHPIRPIVNTGIVYQDNYYNTNYTSNCQQYIDALIQKDEEILVLRRELEKLQNKEQRQLSKSLQKSYETELEAFENRKSSIKIKSSVTISDEPIE
jgi:hypothetical protein